LANQEYLNICEDLGRPRMKIQEVLGDLQEGGILFSNSEASYLKTET